MPRPDRIVVADLPRYYVRLRSYSLMPNHVDLVAVPEREESLGRARVCRILQLPLRYGIDAPEGRQNVATPAGAWILIAETTEPRSGDRFSRRIFRHSVAERCEEPNPRLTGVLLNSNSRWCLSDPLPPSAALPLTEGENKALTLQALISPL
jgi:hypothetical protein